MGRLLRGFGGWAGFAVALGVMAVAVAVRAPSARAGEGDGLYVTGPLLAAPPPVPQAGCPAGSYYVVAATIAVGNNPLRVVMTPDGSEVYVTNSASNSVSVISTASNTVTDTVTVGTNPDSIVVHPDGSKVYVGNSGGNISIINTATKAVGGYGVGAPVRDVAISENGDRLYVAKEFGGLLRVMTATGSVGTVSGTICPEGVIFPPGTNRAYVNYQCGQPPGTGGNDPVMVYNATTNAYVTGFTVGPPHVGTSWMASSPDGQTVWVPGSGTLKKVRTSDNAVLGTIAPPTGAAFATVAPDGARIYVGDNSANLFVYDTTSLALLDTIPIGARGSLAFTADGSRFYANVWGNAVKVVDLVQPLAHPEAADLNPACPGVNVQFSATPAGGAGPWSVQWDFDGDGSADATDEDPLYAFPAAGSYTVRVRVTDAGGCTGPWQEMPGNPMVVLPPAPSAAPALACGGAVCTGQQFAIRWGAVADASAYEVDEGCDGIVDHVTANTFQVLEQASAGSVCYRVRAVNSCGNGPWSGAPCSVSVQAPALQYSVAATIAVGNNPLRVVMTPDGSEVYVTNSASNSVSVISTASNTVTDTVTVGTNPDAIVVHPDGSKVYVGNSGGNISIINTATKAVGGYGVGAPVRDVAISENGDRLYVAKEFGGLLRVMTATGSVGTVSGTICPEGVIFPPGTNRAYVNYQCGQPPGTGGNDPVMVYNATTNAYVTGFTVGPPHVGTSWMTSSPDGQTVWVPGSGTLKKVRTSDNAVLGTIAPPTGAAFATVAPDGARIYVGDNSANLFVYDTTSLALLDTIPIGARGSLAFTADGSRFYANVWGNAVKVVDITPVCPGTGGVPDGSADFAGAAMSAVSGGGDAVVLSWEEACNATDYAVMAGTLAALAEGRYDHTALTCSDAGADRTETVSPAGDGLYFLVVPRGSAGEGSYGRDSGGAQRPPGLSGCGPQVTGTCD